MALKTPAAQAYSQQTVLEAIHWLKGQPDNWAEYIKDSNIAVKMYLKSCKKDEKKESFFKKESNQFLSQKTEDAGPFKEHNLKEEQELGACLTDTNHRPLQTKSPSFGEEQTCLFDKDEPSPSANLNSSCSLNQKESSSMEIKDQNIFEEENKLFNCLDKKSLQVLQKAKEQLNIQREEETLRLLIQLGYKALKKLLY